MRLKTLSIYGFKSFAQKVCLDFDLPLIGVVGPNGCGKSNIVDAFRWVMGEQSSKSLRGETMEDMLFNGSSACKPANFAEVSLTLTEIEGSLPVDYEEVTVTRRLYRNGESEFFINKNEVRLKDIHDIFLGSSLGRKAFSIFEQGKLDEVIFLSPIERRVIFDEAANTSRFLVKKKDSLKKLEQICNNLNRVKDVYEEVKKNTTLLFKQAELAKDYQAKKSHLELLEKSLLFHRYLSSNSSLADLEKTKILFQNEIQELSLEITLIEQKVHESYQKVMVYEKMAQESKETLSSYRSKIDRLIGENEREKYVVEELIINKKACTDEIKKIALELLSQESEYEIIAQDLLNVQKLKFEKEKTVSAVQSKVKTLEEEYKNLHHRHKKNIQDHLKHLQDEKNHIKALQDHTLLLQSLKDKEKTLEESLQKAMREKEELLEEMHTKKANVIELSGKVDEIKKETISTTEQLKNLANSQQEIQALLTSIHRIIAEKKARFDTLMRLKEEREGFSKGAKVLLDQSKNKKSPLFGKIKEFYASIKLPKNAEKALFSRLRFYAHTLIVETEHDFKAILAFAKDKQLSDFSLLCLEYLPNKKNKTPLSLASRFIPEVEFTSDLLPPFTKKGIFIETEGAFFDEWGVFFSEKKEISLFEREAELQNLQEEVSHAEIEKRQHEESLQNLVHLEKEEKNSLSKQIERMRIMEMNLIQENFSLQRAKEDHAKRDLEISVLAAKKNEGIEQQKTLKKDNQHLLFQLETAQNAIREIKNGLEISEKLVEECSREILNRREEKETLEKKFQEIIANEKNSELKQKILESKISQQKVISLNLQKNDQQFEERLKKSKLLLAEQEDKLNEFKKKLEEVLAQGSEDEKKWQKQKEEHSRFVRESERKKNHLREVEKKYLYADSEWNKSKLKSEEFEKDFLERFASPIVEIESEKLIQNLSEELMSELIGKIKRTLNGVERINMTAIEEYNEQEKRCLFLEKQVEDLENTQKDLENIISRLDKECRKLFRKTFEEIKKYFSKNFQILFGGGEAELKFTHSDDILNAGVEIIAKPPGKQMRSISLLSGGEKCLTALALLFAIFEVRPAPFCILDEVDAPLDDSNVDRFTKVLHQFLEKTQFVIVTHNKKTMSICDRLFGISMEQKGVSMLISLSFEKNKESLSAQALTHVSI